MHGDSQSTGLLSPSPASTVKAKLGMQVCLSWLAPSKKTSGRNMTIFTFFYNILLNKYWRLFKGIINSISFYPSNDFHCQTFSAFMHSKSVIFVMATQWQWPYHPGIGYMGRKYWIETSDVSPNCRRLCQWAQLSEMAMYKVATKRGSTSLAGTRPSNLESPRIQ